jgi:phosphatidylglycerol lysyltransferase
MTQRPIKRTARDQESKMTSKVPKSRTAHPGRPPIEVFAVTLATLGSGLINLRSAMGRSLPHRVHSLKALFPLEFIHVSRFLTVLIGFALVLTSLNIYKRKKRAFQLAMLLSCVSVVFHITKGLDYEEATFSFALLLLLLLVRRSFTVRSNVPDAPQAFVKLGAALAVALAYGVAGFWFLDPREFGINFSVGDALHRTFLFLTFVGDPTLIPHSRHARWFLDSLQIVTATSIVYSIYSLFQPILYRLRTLPHERDMAARIVWRHGRCAQDFFKYWADKSFFFSPSRESFLAYRVGRGLAVVLGDPVGPTDEMEALIREFKAFCEENGWRHCYYQTLPDMLPIYNRLKYKKLKIGDDAIVDLPHFTFQGKASKRLRSKVTQLRKRGITAEYLEPPQPDWVLQQAEEVSKEWLHIPGRRERGFTLGHFDTGYLRSEPIFAVRDTTGKFLAFANVIPSFRKGEATIDLMRHRLEAPNGSMDYLFAELFLCLKERGYQRFNLGMAPMAGFQEHEQASIEERAIHYFMKQLGFLFSFSGLYQYKSKFANAWEPRYAIYQNPLDLPRLGLALRAVSELPGRSS